MDPWTIIGWVIVATLAVVVLIGLVWWIAWIMCQFDVQRFTKFMDSL